MASQYTFAPVIPLIGGFPLGAELALEKPPKAIYSYSGFEANDSHYVYYQNAIKNRNIDYINISEQEDSYTDVDIVMCTPPCAGLSSFNSGKTPEARGAGCAKNDWMYISATDAIEKLNAKVVLIENAPGLYTTKGKQVANNLYKIAQDHGYSMTLYKTSTMFHGIPQARDRTFAILWNSSTAPIINYYDREREDFEGWLSKVDNDNSDLTNPKLLEDPYFLFLKTKVDDVREAIKEVGKKTAFQYVYHQNLLDEAIQYFNDTDNEKGLKLAEHAKMKLGDGKNIWDGSMNVYDDRIAALIGRNLISTIHPKEDRSLTIKEALHIMGFPHDLELLGSRKNMNHICQNVPAYTALDMVLEAVKFLDGDLEMSDSTLIKQNNYKQKIDYQSSEDQPTNTLEL